MFHSSPNGKVTGTALRDKSMDVMRIPFQITSESVKDTDDTGSKVFGFIHFIKHAKDNISNGVKRQLW